MGTKRLVDMSQPAQQVRGARLARPVRPFFALKVNDHREEREIKDGFRRNYRTCKGDVPDQLREPERYESFMQSEADNRAIYDRKEQDYSARWYMYKRLFDEKAVEEMAQKIVDISRLYHRKSRSLARAEGI